MAGTERGAEGAGGMRGDLLPRRLAAPLGAVPDWRTELPFPSARFSLFHVVEYLIIGTAYIYHLLTVCRCRGWEHTALWTLVIGGFTAILLLDGPIGARGWERPALIARFLLAASAIWLARIDFITTFLLFSVVANAFSLGQRAGIAIAIASTVAVFGETFLLSGLGDLGDYASLFPWVAGLFFIGGTTQLTIREQEARARSEALLLELRGAHRQLQDYADQAGQLATTQERNRIAREIHDSLGHYLTIINVQLESALALRARDGARADRAVGEAKRLASEALADVRRSVAALRPTALDTLPIGTAIERQVADFRAHSGLPVDLTIEGDEAGCSQAAGLALYRAVQEGLTNIRKHAAATRAAVTVRFGPASTELTIADDGRGLPGPAAPGPRADGGFGLTGIRERMALLGGTLDVHPADRGGTELRAVIPRDGRAAGAGG